MATAVATPQPSIPSSVAAPTAVSPSMPTAPASYPTATPASYSPEAPVAVPQDNPWQAAYQGLLASLNATPSSQPQAPSSLLTQPVAPAPVSPQAAATYSAVPSVMAPLTSAFPQTAAYSPATVAPASSSSSGLSAGVSDEYLQSVSSESLEVLQHFGGEAPALLNRYSCVVEDALLSQAQQTAQALQQLQAIGQQLNEAHTVITAAAEDNAAYHTLLTDPDLLADYVNDFYGPQGPYPTETAQDRLAAEVYANENRMAPAPQPLPQAAPSYRRPQMEMPAPDVQAASGGDEFWAAFSQLSDRNPAAAWQLLSQASPEALRSKVLVSEA